MCRIRKNEIFEDLTKKSQTKRNRGQYVFGMLKVFRIQSTSFYACMMALKIDANWIVFFLFNSIFSSIYLCLCICILSYILSIYSKILCCTYISSFSVKKEALKIKINKLIPFVGVLMWNKCALELLIYIWISKICVFRKIFEGIQMKIIISFSCFNFVRKK